MKKLISLLCALVILLGCCSGAVAAKKSDFVIKKGVLVKYTGKGGDIEIPDGVTEIAEGVFAFKTVNSVKFPSTLKVIGRDAFMCISGNMRQVTIPASVEKIGAGAFRGNTGDVLENILVAAGNKRFKSVNGVLLSKNGRELYCYPSGKRAAVYQVPKSVRVIKELSFGNSTLNTVELPSSVRTIESNAFYVSKIREITIPAGVTSLCSDAFDYCENLRTLVIKSEKTQVVDNGFTGTKKLTIYAPDASPVKALAKRNNVKFKALEKKDPTLTGMKLNKEKATLTRTADKTSPTLQLKATLKPSDTQVKVLKWTSSDSKVATVDKNGLVTALKAGTATITCTAANNKAVKATCEITVKDQGIKSISLADKKITLKKGATKELQIKAIKPASALNRDVKWTSSDEKVATVDKNGKVKAVGKGTCTITVTAKDSENAKASVTVTVK